MQPKLVSYEQSIACTHPEIAREWHPTLNLPVAPEQVSKGSRFNAWWICPVGHKWQNPLYSRTRRNTQCVFCSGKKVLAGFNDVLTTHPFIQDMLHETRNEGLKLTEFSQGSDKKIWWKCSVNHEWQASIKSITRSQKCPLCYKYEIFSNSNFALNFPELIKEWHPSRNGDKLPEHFGRYSETRIWWQCIQGHEWEKTIRRRISNPQCPYCLRTSTNTSLIEKKAIAYLEEQLDIANTPIFKTLIDNRNFFHTIDGCFIVENLVFFVEYDGEYWHTDKEVVDRDFRKTKLILDASDNYYLIRLRENELSHLPIEDERLLQQSITQKTFESSLDNVVDWIQNIIQQQEITQYAELEMTYQPIFRLAPIDSDRVDNSNIDTLIESHPQSRSVLELTHEAFVLSLKESLEEELVNFDIKYADYLKYLDANEPHRKQEWVHSKKQSIAHRLEAIRDGRITMLVDSEE